MTAPVPTTMGGIVLAVARPVTGVVLRRRRIADVLLTNVELAVVVGPTGTGVAIAMAVVGRAQRRPSAATARSSTVRISWPSR